MIVLDDRGYWNCIAVTLIESLEESKNDTIDDILKLS